MNLNKVIANHSKLRIAAIVDHLLRCFGIPPHARDLALVLGKGTEACPREAMRYWVTEQCRELAGQPIEFPLQTIERRLFDHLQAHGYDLYELDLPTPTARDLRVPLPNPDQERELAHRLRDATNEPALPRHK